MLKILLVFVSISANKKALGQEYLPALRTMLTSPLINEGSDGVGKVVSILDAYDLLREDFDSIIELTSWTGMNDPMGQIDSKVTVESLLNFFTGFICQDLNNALEVHICQIAFTCGCII